MATDLFLKKYLKSVLIGILVLIFIGILGYTGSVSNKKRIEVRKNFYFLVSTSTHVEASTHFVSWSGGSGYLLEDNGREYVVFSVYLQKEDALSVQELLKEPTQLITRSVECLYTSDENLSKGVKGAFQTYYGWLTVLQNEINRLAQGCTQQSSKRILNILKKQMEYSSKKYENDFSDYADVCKIGAEQLTQITNGTVYVKDLRYLLCEFCVAYCQLANLYTI